MMPFHMLLPEIVKSPSAMMMPRPALGSAKSPCTRMIGQREVSAVNQFASGNASGVGTLKSAGIALLLMMPFQSMVTSGSSWASVLDVSSGGLPVGTKPPDDE